MQVQNNIIQQNKRTYIPNDFSLDSWDQLEAFYVELNDREIDSQEAFEKWIKNWDELYAVVSEIMRWKYINTSIDTTDTKAQEELQFFYVNIDPKMKPWENKLQIKFNDSPYKNNLSKDFNNFKRSIESDLKLFNEKNIEISKELSLLENEYAGFSGAWSINYKDKEYTLPQAAKFNKSINREERKTVFNLTNERKAQDEQALDDLFNTLIKKRHELALNAGFENFRDYSFAAMGRFDYTPDDCVKFHESVASAIIPLVKIFDEERKAQLGLESLKPWDTLVDPLQREPLQPFVDTADFVNKTIECFNQLDTYFGDCITNMYEINRLDLESRKGKAPGGYMMAMPESGVPFIFMNHATSEGDVRVMVHEGGHAVHSFLDYSVEHATMRQTPSEVAELASMAMELFSLENWESFYPNEDDLNRAKKNHLEGLLRLLPSVARGDAFQHWIYTNPNHTTEERHAKWLELNKIYGTGVVESQEFDAFNRSSYQSVLHFYQVPFYYIEYGFAQLGAIALWRNFKNNNSKTIQEYKNALSLGYTRSIPEIYETAGIKFDFSEKNVSELAQFVKAEIEKL